MLEGYLGVTYFCRLAEEKTMCALPLFSFPPYSYRGENPPSRFLFRCPVLVFRGGWTFLQAHFHIPLVLPYALESLRLPSLRPLGVCLFPLSSTFKRFVPLSGIHGRFLLCKDERLFRRPFSASTRLTLVGDCI